MSLPEVTATEGILYRRQIQDQMEYLAGSESASVDTTTGSLFTQDIPAGVTEITVHFDFVGVSGSDDILVQLGTGGSLTVSGYSSASNSEGAFTGLSASSSGFAVRRSGAIVGNMTIVRKPGGNIWTSTHGVRFFSGGNNIAQGAGRVSISGEADIIGLAVSGSDTFNGGSWAVSWR